MFIVEEFDAILNVGTRKALLTIGFFSCQLKIEDKLQDARVYPIGKPGILEPEDWSMVQVKLLTKASINYGEHIEIFEGNKAIGSVCVVGIDNENNTKYS